MKVAEPQKLTFEGPVAKLQVRIASGTVNVVGTDGDATRLEVSRIAGPPLAVAQEDGTLSIGYDDLPWQGVLKWLDRKWLDRKGQQRDVAVSLAVPAGTAVEVGVVDAAAMVSGIDGPTSVRGVSGDTTLVALSGSVLAETVSGGVEAQAVTGELRFHSVSGDLTVVEAAGSSVRAESVSGDMIVDIGPSARPCAVQLANVSGEIAIRLPHPADATVEADTTSGAVSNAFEDLRVGGQWGAKRITGRLGAGTGRLKATTVSGSIALLRRPPEEPEGPGAPQESEGPGVPQESKGPVAPGATPGDGPSSDLPDDEPHDVDPPQNPPTDPPTSPGGAPTGKVL